jgi:type II secretory pathway pseudopilin PulG
MNLAAIASQTHQRNSGQSGYAMAALLVGMAVMAIMLSVAMPTWNQMIRREKEEELVFRGNQYARAINFYQRKFANASKKYRDPMSPDKDGAFQPLYINNSSQSGRLGSPGQAGQQSAAGQPGSVGTALGTTPTGGIMGVTSKNKGESLRVFNGKTHYNEWQFIAMQTSTQGGAGAPGGRAGAGGRGQGSIRPDGSIVGRDGRGNPIDTGRGRGPGGPGSTFVPSRGGQVSPPTPFQPGSQPPPRGPR